MISPSVVYPQSPTGDRSVVKETSVSFRKEVGKVLTSIVLFFIVYVLLIFLAVILAVDDEHHVAHCIVSSWIRSGDAAVLTHTSNDATRDRHAGTVVGAALEGNRPEIQRAQSR